MATGISFWTEVKRPEFPLGAAESYYSFLSSNAVYVMMLLRGNGYEVYEAERSGLTAQRVVAYVATVLPIIAYAFDKLGLKKAIAFSLALPVSALLFKSVLHRYLSLATVIKRATQEQVIGFNELKNTSKISHPSSLNFGETYLLSEEDRKTHQKITLRPCDHLLPQGNNEIYSIPAVYYCGTSELYPDSYFAYQYKGTYNKQTERVENDFWEVVMYPKNPQPWDDDEQKTMTVADVVELALLPIDRNEAISLRPEYVGSTFTYEKQGDEYSVTRSIITAEYSKIEFNMATPLSEAELLSLRLTSDGLLKMLVPKEKWKTATSSIKEYSNSIFLFLKREDKYTVVRMLKPEVK